MCMFGEGEKHKIHLDFIWEFPGNPVVDSASIAGGTGCSLVKELRSHLPRCAAKNKQTKKYT